MYEVIVKGGKEEPLTVHESVKSAMEDVWFVLFKRGPNHVDLALFAEYTRRLRQDGNIAIAYGDRKVIARRKHYEAQ